MIFPLKYISLIIMLIQIQFKESESKYVFQELYRKNTSIFLKKNTYLCDSIAPIENLNFDYIKPNLKPSDTLLVKQILKNGKVNTFPAKKISSFLPAKLKLVSLKKFYKTKPGKYYLTRCETQVFFKLDSIDKIIYQTSPDSETNRSLKVMEDSLLNSNCFNSYRAKLLESEKRLIVFFPTYRYENYYLVAFSYYNSLTNNFLFIEIIDANLK